MKLTNEMQKDLEKLKKYENKKHKTKKFKYYVIYKKISSNEIRFVCFAGTKISAKAICENFNYYYEEIEKEIEVD